jgi:hypothetical protein
MEVGTGTGEHIHNPPSSVEIRFRQLSCVDYVASGLSCGCLPALLLFYWWRLPARLTEEGVVLRSGRLVPWGNFRRAQATDFYYHGVFRGTRYQLWHTAGRVEIDTDRIRDPEAVVRFLRDHLPPTVSETGRREQEGI